MLYGPGICSSPAVDLLFTKPSFPPKSAMEIEGQDGSITHLKEGSQLVFGRGRGFDPNDLAVSRRHISFDLSSNTQSPPRVSFEVTGKNPIWVCYKDSGEIRAFRRFERGELGVGDLFCATSVDPVWFSLKKGDEIERKLGECLDVEASTSLDESAQDLDLGFDAIDVSSIDPVKEFGFLVIGHEFDNHPKAKILDVRSWNWFLEDDTRGDSTDDEDESHHGKQKKPLRRKRKKKANGEEDDEEWTGESEDDDEVVIKARKPHERKYSTRSKDGGGKKGSTQKRSKHADVEEDEEGEEDDDETLGGFIVDDVDEGEERDEDEEEEFEEDEDD